MDSMFPSTRSKAFNNAPEIVAQCFASSAGPTLRRIIANEGYIPEFMYYSTMGRADLVQFSVWNEKRFRTRDKQMTLARYSRSSERV